MYTRLKAICPFRDGYKIINLFGHSSKSFPGTEINGLGKYGRSTKEKFIYLAKELDIKIPIKRIVLCIEEEDIVAELSPSERAWIELPLLILFLFLIEHISISKLEDCFSMGKVSVVGNIIQPDLDDNKFSQILQLFDLWHLKYICTPKKVTPKGLKTIPLEQLISHNKKINFL